MDATESEPFDARVAKAKTVALNKDIAKFAREKNLLKAQEYYNLAVSSGMANSHTYSAIINAYVRCGQIEEAFEVYQSLKSNPSRVRLDVISCTTMMKGFCGQGNIQASKGIIADMLSSQPKIVPNVRSINTFLRGCVLTGALREAEDIFPRIQQEFKIAPDISSWEYLVTLLSQGLAIDKILPIIGRLRNDKSLSGGVAAMCVNLSRAAALLTELKICRKYLSLATQLLEEDEEIQLVSNSTKSSLSTPSSAHVKSSQQQTMGGKQAWKQVDPDDARAQSLEVYQEHRRAELRQEIGCISAFIQHEGLSIDATLPYFKRILLFNHSAQDSSISGENQKTFLVDDLLAAMVWSLGYEKALMKKYTDSTNPVQFQLKRISQPSDLPTSKPEKKKGKKPKPKTKKTPSSSSLLVPELIAEGLREMRGHLENCFTSTGSLEPCHLFRDEDQSLPLKLEICSGFGEWAVKQAVADLGKSNWLTLELKQDRVYQTFTRSIFEGASNLAILCGDALKILPAYIAESTLTHVFVNYPEPPQQLGGDDTQSKHLLTEEFFTMIDRVLVLNGILTILTDNLWYGRLLLKIVSSNSNGRHFINGEAPSLVQESLRGFTLYSGKPGPECGYNVEATSYFDRLWQRGRQPDRYFLVIKKTATPAMTLNFGRSTKRSAAQLQVSASVAPKKIKFNDDESED